MKINDSDLFFTCSLIELIGRSTKQKRSAVVALLGEKILSHIYSNAGVLHCEPIAKNADAFIEMCNIPEGTFDNVADCKYEVPDYWTIGKVFARLIEDVASGNAIETLQEVYLSPVCDALSNYNSDFFYQPRGFIKEFYLDECKNSLKKRKTPALRFAGFTDAWEQREFENSFSLLQNNTLSRSELSDSPGVAANIHYGDVLIKFGEYLDIVEETFPWIKKQTDADKFRMSFLQDGDIIFADTAEDETAGKCCEIRNCGSTVIISGLHTIPCRPESKFSPGYLGYYLNSTAFHEQLIPLMQGTKVVSISKTALKSTNIQYPSDDKEQQKIGQLFQALDRLITLHQRECFFSRIRKKLKITSQKTNAWEQRKLGQIAQETHGGGTPKTSCTHFWNGEIPWIQSSDIEDGKVENVIPRKRISQQGLNQSAARLVPGNSIAIVTRVGVGKLALMTFPYTTSQDFLSLSKLSVDAYWGVYALYHKLQQEVQSVQGTSIKGMTKEYALALTVNVPCKEQEQQKIGAFFQSIDRLITLHQRERLFLILEEILC